MSLRICGDWPATTGLAHAARRLALAILHDGVDLKVSTFRSGAPREQRLYPPELLALRAGALEPVTLWTLNINELHQVPDEEFRSAAYNIATWYWELPTIPTWMHPQFERVSEVWAPSRFVQRAMIRYTDKPVSVIPPVVPVFDGDGSTRELRERLGLPDVGTIFLASFDFNSAVSRKNPIGVVDAFVQAFPRSRASQGPLLVMKAINLPKDQPFTEKLRSAMQEAGGILIDRNLAHKEFADLFHACDVYVSLHRSEGFGLGLAESMAIGKPVIGTAYSGNLDFMSAANSCLVGYRLREIEPSDQADNPGIEGTYTEGALWAEPDLEHAAHWMSLLDADAEQRHFIGSQGQRTILSSFSEAYVGAAAIRRLVELNRQLGIG